MSLSVFPQPLPAYLSLKDGQRSDRAIELTKHERQNLNLVEDSNIHEHQMIKTIRKKN